MPRRTPLWRSSVRIPEVQTLDEIIDLCTELIEVAILEKFEILYAPSDDETLMRLVCTIRDRGLVLQKLVEDREREESSLRSAMARE